MGLEISSVFFVTQLRTLSSLPFLVFPPLDVEALVALPKGVGGFSYGLCPDLLRWVVVTRWSNETSASAYWPHRDWLEMGPLVLCGQLSPLLCYQDKFLCIAFGSCYFHKLLSVFRFHVPWPLARGQKMNFRKHHHWLSSMPLRVSLFHVVNQLLSWLRRKMLICILYISVHVSLLFYVTVWCCSFVNLCERRILSSQVTEFLQFGENKKLGREENRYQSLYWKHGFSVTSRVI